MAALVLTPRDKRALVLLVPALLVGLAIRFWPEPTAARSTTAGVQNAEQGEQRLKRLRELAATVPAKQDVLKKVNADLASREKGLLQADTAAQAQAQVLQILRRLASSETPPIPVRGTEIGAVGLIAGAYGIVNVSVQMECRVEQLVNLLAAIGQQPELLAPSELRITSSSPKEKVVGVRLSVSALVPRKLVPDKKGPAGP